MTRKLIAKKFALPWLKKVMELDVDRYKDICHRQIRILEREMAPEAERDSFVNEDKEVCCSSRCLFGAYCLIFTCSLWH